MRWVWYSVAHTLCTHLLQFNEVKVFVLTKTTTGCCRLPFLWTLTPTNNGHINYCGHGIQCFRSNPSISTTKLFFQLYSLDIKFNAYIHTNVRVFAKFSKKYYRGQFQFFIILHNYMSEKIGAIRPNSELVT